MIVAWSFAATLTALALSLGAAGAPNSACLNARWRVDSSPQPRNAELASVAAISNRDIWAVGVASLEPEKSERALVEHWTGAGWERVSVPPPGGHSSSLSAVVAVGADDVWAVGKRWRAGEYSTGGNSDGQTLAEHWDGTSWKIVPTPALPVSEVSHVNQLVALTAVSRTDIWAVGVANRRPLIEHWDGSTWKIVRSPVAGPRDARLSGVTAASRDDVWAVGFSGSRGPLTEHWDGRSWRLVTVPPPRPLELYGVEAVSARDVWAIGHGARPGSTGIFEPDVGWIEHWDGAAWSAVSSQWALVGRTPYAASLGLNGVSGLSRKDVWTVGTGENSRQPLIEHWDGASWKRQSSPAVGCGPKAGVCGAEQELQGVTAISTEDIWAVGSADLGLGRRQSLIEHYACA